MILINGNEVHTTTSEAVKYGLVNPHLVYESIPASSAEIPSFPPDAANRRAFGFWEEPQAGNYLPEFLYQHLFGGELIREGYFLLTEGSAATGYKGAFSDKLGLFFGELQNMPLPEIDFGTLPLPAPLVPVLTDPLGSACAFPTVVNESYFGTNGGSVAYTGKVNDYASGAYKVAGPKVPMFFACWVLKKIAVLTGTRIEGDFFQHPQWSQLLLVNLRQAETATIDTRLHLPGFTVAGFLLELRKIPNLKFTFNSVAQTLRIDFWEDDLAAPTTLDWTTRATAGQTKTPEPNSRVQLSMALDSNDALAKDRPAELADWVSAEVEGNRNGIAKLDMKFSTLLVDTATGLPACKQEGQTSQFGQETKPWAPRLLFWQGIVSGYPRALPTFAGTSLFPAALATTSWKQTIALRERMFYVQKTFVLTEVDVARLDFGKKIHVEGMDYLLAQLDVTIPIKGAATALLIGGV